MACTSCKKKTEISEKFVPSVGDFSLRNTGVHQINFGSDLFISNANMTNQLAIQFLKENPNRISLFETFPANWKDLVNPKQVETEITKVKVTRKSK